MRLSSGPGTPGGRSTQRGAWTPGKQRAGGPIRSGPLAFVGGIGGWYPERRPEGPGDARRQFSDALEIMKAGLERAGTSMDRVLHIQVALVDPARNFDAIDEIYRRTFAEPRPALSWFGAADFRRAGQLLQVDAIAWIE